MNISNEDIFKRFGEITDIVETNCDEINSLSEKVYEHLLVDRNGRISANYILSKFFLDNFILVIDRNDTGGTYIHVVNDYKSNIAIFKIMYNSSIQLNLKGYDMLFLDKTTGDFQLETNPVFLNYMKASGAFTEEELKEKLIKSADMFARTVLMINTAVISSIGLNNESLFEVSRCAIKKNSKKKSKGSKNKVSIFNKYLLKPNNLRNLNSNARKAEYVAESWGVRGYHRTLKNGEKIWIKPGVRKRNKELLKTSSGEYASKTYSLQ